MLIAKNEFAISTFEDKKRVVRSTFKGRANLKLLYSHLEELGDFYVKNRVSVSIVDTRGIYGSFAKALDYWKAEFYLKQ